MKKQKKICVSQLQLALSRTLRWATEKQASVLITNRGEVTHRIIPYSDDSLNSNYCACSLNAAEREGGSDECQC